MGYPVPRQIRHGPHETRRIRRIKIRVGSLGESVQWARELASACMADLMDEQMGHADGSVQARYSHVTAAMRAQLLAGLTEVWHAALDSRQAMAGGSPVRLLDQVLAERRREAGK
jgi:hypothetical protein